MFRRLLAASVALCALTLAATHGGAAAAASVNNGKVTCTVTALAATLSKTSLTAKASIVCTGATTATVSIAVAEMDGTVEQTIQTPRLLSVAVTKANTAVAISGATITCPNTESTKEEYASKVQAVLTTSTGTKVTSAWDYKIPANDAYAC